MTTTLKTTDLAGLPSPKRGKVRDIYDLGDRLLIVACDRISAYDHVLEPAIPDKGKILHQLSNHWFEHFASLVPNHLLATEIDDFPGELLAHADQLSGRAALVRKARVIPFECVARGYLAGSAFRGYRRNGSVCGIELPGGLVRASRLPEPLFTPATKAESGHDENVSEEYMMEAIGEETTSRLKELTLRIYRQGSEETLERGLILADTKFEFGFIDDEIALIDEVLTPDSSRYWDLAAWEPGVEPESFDKQYVRNWLDDAGWDHESPPPRLPDEVVEGTRQRYLEAFRRITGHEPDL